MTGKDLLQSKAFWGLVVALGAVSLKSRGIDIGDQEGWTMDLITLAAAVLSVVGRIKASRPIHSIAGVPLSKGGLDA